MEGFRIDLKTFLALAMPNQHCLTVGNRFWSNIVGQEIPNPTYSTTVLYDTKLPQSGFVILIKLYTCIFKYIQL